MGAHQTLLSQQDTVLYTTLTTRSSSFFPFPTYLVVKYHPTRALGPLTLWPFHDGISECCIKWLGVCPPSRTSLRELPTMRNGQSLSEWTMGRISAKSTQEPNLTGILTNQISRLQTKESVFFSSPYAVLLSICPRPWLVDAQKKYLQLSPWDTALLPLLTTHVRSLLQSLRSP